MYNCLERRKGLNTLSNIPFKVICGGCDGCHFQGCLRGWGELPSYYAVRGGVSNSSKMVCFYLLVPHASISLNTFIFMIPLFHVYHNCISWLYNNVLFIIVCSFCMNHNCISWLYNDVLFIIRTILSYIPFTLIKYISQG